MEKVLSALTSARFWVTILMVAAYCWCVVGKIDVPDAFVALVTAAVMSYFNRSDRAKPDGSGAVKLLVLALLAGMFCMGSPAMADDLAPGTYWHVGQFEFFYPLRQIDATPWWKSLTTGDEMFGAQTTLIGAPRKTMVVQDIPIPPDFLKLAFGGITSAKANGMPYLSLTVKVWGLTNLQGQEILYIGTGYGRDFRENKDHILVGATYPLLK